MLVRRKPVDFIVPIEAWRNAGGAIEVWEFWFGLPWGDTAGHVSYLIIAISYWLTNIYWLRVTAVVGLCFEVAYFVLISGSTLYTGIAWDLVFIAINLLHLARLTRERLRLRLATESAIAAHHVRRAGRFADRHAAQQRVLAQGAGRRAAHDRRRSVPALMMIAAGQVLVAVGDTVVAQIGRGSFIGEMAFLTGGNASATVTATYPTRVMKIEQSRLKTLLVIDHQIAAVLHRLLGADLALKLRARNEAA